MKKLVARVRLNTDRVLKGSAPEQITVVFSEVAVRMPPGFKLNQARVWLLNKAPNVEIFHASALFTSVLDESNEVSVIAAINDQQSLRRP